MNAAQDALPSPLSELPDELLLAILSHLQVKRGFVADEQLEAQRRIENTVVLHTAFSP